MSDPELRQMLLETVHNLTLIRFLGDLRQTFSEKERGELLKAHLQLLAIKDRMAHTVGLSAG